MTPTQTKVVMVPDAEGTYENEAFELELSDLTEAGFVIVGVVPAHGHRPALVLLSTDELVEGDPGVGE